MGDRAGRGWARLRQSTGWWTYGFPILGMVVWGCGTLLVYAAYRVARDGAESYYWRELPEVLAAVGVFCAVLGLFLSVAVGAGAGLAAEFAKSATERGRGVVAVLCALVVLAPLELAIFFCGLPMGDGPASNFGLAFNLEVPWASPYAHVALVGYGAWRAVRAKSAALRGSTSNP